MKVRPKIPAKPSRSLTEFMQAKRRAGCPVCALPPAVREQLKDASKRKITRVDQIEWLAAECGVKLTRALFDSHANGKHDL